MKDKFELKGSSLQKGRSGPRHILLLTPDFRVGTTPLQPEDTGVASSEIFKNSYLLGPSVRTSTL